MTDRPEISIEVQTAFTPGGELEAAATQVETSLSDYGAAVDHHGREARLDRPAASQFGVDDRPEVTRADPGDQATLFVDAPVDQRTLAGDDAAGQCPFED